jgi:hypothetical protein
MWSYNLMPMLKLVTFTFLLMRGWVDLRASVDIWEITISCHCFHILSSFYDSNSVSLISTLFSEESFLCSNESVCLV